LQASQSNSIALEQAAHWKTLLTSGEANASDQAAFQAWLDESYEHKKAYQSVEQFWRKFDHLDSVSAKKTLLKTQSTQKIATGLKASLTIFLVALTSWGILQSSIGEYYLAEYRTVAGETKEVILDDGSRITLNTGTAVDIHYQDNQRLIKLRQGEIYVQVAKQKNRPFIVETTHGTAQALGTQYTVKKLGNSTSVGVIESNVKVCTHQGYFDQNIVDCINLNAGMGVHEIKWGMKPIAINIDSVAGWKSGYLSFESEPLINVLNELKRYTPEKIYYDADTVNDLWVSGVIPITDMDKTYAMLNKLLPITIKRYPYLAIVSKKDHKESP